MPAAPGDSALSAAELAAARVQMLALVRRICPRWLADQAEDIVQTALLSVLQHQKRGGEDPLTPASYLMRAAHNALIDEVRRRFRRPTEIQGDPMDLKPAVSPNPTPDDRASSLEIDRGIRGCLASLPRARRIAVTLHLLGYSLRETGEGFGWTPKRTEHLIYRGLEDIRRCLTRKGLAP